MSKPYFPTPANDSTPDVAEEVNRAHLETTARGVERAREALAQAQANHAEAERLHRENLMAELAIEKEKLRLIRIELHGEPIAEKIQEKEAQEAQVIAEAEAALESEGHS
jgi:hypothetical protein